MKDNRQPVLKKWLDLIDENQDGTQAIYAAMDEYAKQEALEFNRWYKMFKKEKLQNAPTKEGYKYWLEKTPEEYYELYLESKK